MKISKKRFRAIRDALDDAANEVAAEHVRDLSNRPPDDWNPEEKLAFDVAHEVKHRLSDKLKTLFHS